MLNDWFEIREWDPLDTFTFQYYNVTVKRPFHLTMEKAIPVGTVLEYIYVDYDKGTMIVRYEDQDFKYQIKPIFLTAVNDEHGPRPDNAEHPTQ